MSQSNLRFAAARLSSVANLAYSTEKEFAYPKVRRYSQQHESLSHCERLRIVQRGACLDRQRRMGIEHPRRLPEKYRHQACSYSPLPVVTEPMNLLPSPRFAI